MHSKNCATFFQVSLETRVTELLDHVVEHSRGNGSSDKLTQPNEVMDMDDIKYFRRMHVIMDRFKPTILPGDDAHRLVSSFPRYRSLTWT